MKPFMRIWTFGFLSVLSAGCQLDFKGRILVIDEERVLEVGPAVAQELRLSAKRGPVLSASLAGRQLMLVWQDGTAALVSLDQPTEHTVLTDNALAVAWSSDGRRLAILRSPQNSGFREAVLELRDDEYKLQWSKQVAITQAVSRVGVLPHQWTHRLSWSADGELLAISTSSDGQAEFPAECIIVDIAHDRQYYQPNLCDVCFIGKRSVVAHEGFQRFGRIRIYDLGLYADNIDFVVRDWKVDGAMIATSAPESGRFGIWDPQPRYFLPGYRVSGFLRFYDSNGQEIGTLGDIYSMNSLVCMIDTDS